MSRYASKRRCCSRTADRRSRSPGCCRCRRSRRINSDEPGVGGGVDALASKGPAGRGLGCNLALQCVDRGAWTPSRLDGLRGTPARLLPEAADEFFAAHRLHGGDRLEQGFGVLVAVAGEGRLIGDNDNRSLQRGDTLLIPYAAGPLRLDGPVEAIRLSD